MSQTEPAALQGDVPYGQNPFSAHRLRPGALPCLFSSGQSAESLLERLRAAGGRGQIVGPHGSGKSTLLAAPLAAIDRAERPRSP